MLWMWGCEYEYACGMYASVHVRLEWEREGDAGRLVTVHTLKRTMWKFKKLIPIPKTVSTHTHTHTQERRRRNKVNIVIQIHVCRLLCIWKRVSSSMTVPSDTTRLFNKWMTRSEYESENSDTRCTFSSLICCRLKRTISEWKETFL